MCWSNSLKKSIPGKPRTKVAKVKKDGAATKH
jgi:hypothetical protein